MSDTTETIRPAAEATTITTDKAVVDAGVTVVNKDQELEQQARSALEGLQVKHHAGELTPVETHPNADVGVIIPFKQTEIKKTTPIDTTATHWWNNMFQTRHTEQQEEKEELPNAA